MTTPPKLTRREMLAGTAGLVGGAMLTGLPLEGQAPEPAPAVPPDATKLQGAPTAPLGARSPFEAPTRAPTSARRSAPPRWVRSVVASEASLPLLR